MAHLALTRTLRSQELVALVRQERDANKKRKAELAALRRAVAAALLPSAAEGDEAVDIATLVQALEGLTSAGAGAGSGAGAAPEGGLHMVESSAAEAEMLELQVPARLHDARGIAAHALMLSRVCTLSLQMVGRRVVSTHYVPGAADSQVYGMVIQFDASSNMHKVIAEAYDLLYPMLQ